MQISLKFIRGINHAKSTICIKFQLLVTFSSLFTGSSSLSVFERGVLYHHSVILLYIFCFIMFYSMIYLMYYSKSHLIIFFNDLSKTRSHLKPFAPWNIKRWHKPVRYNTLWIPLWMLTSISYSSARSVLRC